MILKPAAKPNTVMKRGGIIACTVLTLLTPLGLLLIRLARTDAAAVERWYSLGLYRGMATALTALTGRLPFSAMEVILLLLGAGHLMRMKYAARWRCVGWLLLCLRLAVLVCVCGILLVYPHR